LTNRHDPEESGDLQNVQDLADLKHPGGYQAGDQVKQDHGNPDRTKLIHETQNVRKPVWGDHVGQTLAF